MLDEAAALEIHPRQPVGALRIPARDAHEVVLHAERLGVRRDAVRHDDRDRPQHELAEHHVMDDPLPVAEVAPGQDVGELVRPERLERPIVDRDPGERARDRLEQLRLHVGEAGLGCDSRRDAPRDERHFFDVVVIDTRSVRGRGGGEAGGRREDQAPEGGGEEGTRALDRPSREQDRWP